MGKNQQNCKDCISAVTKYGHQNTYIECHKKSPTLLSKGQYGEWPRVHLDDWCSEWKQHEPYNKD